MLTPKRALLAISFACLVGAVSTAAEAGETVFTKVIDSTSICGYPFGCFDFGESPPGRRRRYPEPHLAMDEEGNLAFFSGRLVAIVDGRIHGTSVPDGDLGQVEIDHGRVTFGVIGREGGIFRWEPGNPIEEVAGGRTPFPHAEGCIFWTEEQGVANHVFEAEGDAIMFAGVSDDCGIRGSSGTFLWRNGSIEKLGDVAHAAVFEGQRVAFFTRDWTLDSQELGNDRESIIGHEDRLPGRPGVYVVGSPQVAAGRVAFHGRDLAGPVGVYLWEDGVITVLAEQGMDLPGGRTLDWSSYAATFRLGADRVAIYGDDESGSFLYVASLDGAWERTVDLGHLGDDSMDEFNSRQLLLDGRDVVYVLRANGSVTKVLERGDVLEGEPAEEIYAGDLRRDELVLGVRRSSGHAIYVAQLPPIPIEIDVRPVHRSNRFHQRSRRPIRVAILGSETFDVEDVDLETVRFGPDAAQTVGRPKLRDVNRDGWRDLVLRFRPGDTSIASGAGAVCLSAETSDAVKLEGCDTIRSKGVRPSFSP